MTETIREQILAIRDTGLTNMFDLNMVQRLAYDRNYYELVCYIEETPRRIRTLYPDRRGRMSLAAKRAGRLFWSYTGQFRQHIFVHIMPPN